MDDARCHDPRATDQNHQARTNAPGRTRTVAMVAALLAVMLAAMTMLITTTGIEHGLPGAAPSHLRMRF
ncbi:MAG: hypothetical protein WB902_23215 [Acetobacteraceae bacterium]|jgi:hypothetical protein